MNPAHTLSNPNGSVGGGGGGGGEGSMPMQLCFNNYYGNVDLPGLRIR